MNETSPGKSAPYPAELERDVTLRDGTTLRLRPIRPDDAPRLVDYYGRLSAHTAYQRFFTVRRPPVASSGSAPTFSPTNPRTLDLLRRFTDVHAQECTIDSGVVELEFGRRSGQRVPPG